MASSEAITALDVCLAAIDATNKEAATGLTYVDFEDEILSPGTYNSDAAMSLLGTLYLNIRDETGEVADPTWYLYLTGALTTGAASKVVFVSVDPAVYANVPYVYDDGTNGRTDTVFDPTAGGTNALTSGVHWKLHGALTVGESSNLAGDVKTNGAITVGSAANTGNLEALGAITLGPASHVGNVRATGAITYGDVHATNGDIYDKTAQNACAVETDLNTCNSA
jgi:hypothetical protein